MKKMHLVKCLGLSVALTSAASFASAPVQMNIINKSSFITNAYVHDIASPAVLAPHSVEKISWANVKKLCHNLHAYSMKSSDPCSFEVYATTDKHKPKQIDVGTVTFYVNDGEVVNIANKGLVYGLKIDALAPGQFVMSNI